MPNIAELLSEANVPEEVAVKIEEMFDQKLEEGIQHGIDSRIEGEKLAWATKQAELVESHLQTVVESWATEQTELLESAVKTEVLEESMNHLRGFLGIGEINLKESADVILTGKVESLTNTLDTVEGQLTEALNVNAAQAETIEQYKRSEYFAEATLKLSDHTCDKIMTRIEELVENNHFEDFDAYKLFVDSMVEAYTPAAGAPEKVDPAVDNVLENTNVNNPNPDDGKQKPISLAEATVLSMQGKKL